MLNLSLELIRKIGIKVEDGQYLKTIKQRDSVIIFASTSGTLYFYDYEEQKQKKKEFGEEIFSIDLMNENVSFSQIRF